jgi:hypothetical protein
VKKEPDFPQGKQAAKRRFELESVLYGFHFKTARYEVKKEPVFPQGKQAAKRRFELESVLKMPNAAGHFAIHMMNEPESNPPLSHEAQNPVAVIKRHRGRLLTALIWLAVCSGLLTYLVLAVQKAREVARCEWCQNNLRQIGIGLDNFDSANSSLPPAFLCDEQGKPTHSWQALTLPYLGHYHWQEAYNLKEPWGSPNNKKCQAYSFNEFQCRSVDRAPANSPIADYVAVLGPETMWPGRDRVKLPPKGEGNPDAILLIEMPDSDYRCLQPRCPTVVEFLAKLRTPSGKGIRCIHPKGLAYLTVGGEVRWFPPDTEVETVRRLLRRDPQCKVIPPEQKIGIVEHWGEQKEGK